MSKRFALTVLAPTLVMLTACSTANSSESPPTPVASATAPASASRATTPPAAPTRPAPTTAAPTTTASTTTTPAPTTTIPPTTTTSPEAAIRNALERQRVGIVSCFEAPADCDPSGFASGEYLVNVRRTMTDFANAGFFGAEGPEPELYAVRAVDFGRTTASVDLCYWSTGVIYGPPTGPGQPPTVVDDQRMSHDVRVEINYNGGTWYVSSFNTIESHTGVNTCDA